MSQRSQMMISAECSAIERLLVEKNRKYGDSALQPIQVGGVTVSPEQGIIVRIGDKWKRWNNAQLDEDEDVVFDLIGYLILLRVARKQAAEDAAKVSPPP